MLKKIQHFGTTKRPTVGVIKCPPAEKQMSNLLDEEFTMIIALSHSYLCRFVILFYSKYSTSAHKARYHPKKKKKSPKARFCQA